MAKRSKTVFTAFQKGDPSAYRNVQAWVKDAILKYAKNRRDLQNDSDQEDLCQVALSRLSDPECNNPAKIKNLGAYIYVVAKRICIDFLDEHQNERAGLRKELQKRPEPPRPPARADSDQGADVVPRSKKRLQRVLMASLDYIDLAFRLRRAYESDEDRFSKTIRPLLKARDMLKGAASAVKPVFRMQIPEADLERLIGPLVAELVATRQRLDEEVRSKLYAPVAADDPDWPLDFNEFADDAAYMRLRPATLIFRVWRKIIKKGKGQYTDYAYMSERHAELKQLLKGTKKEYLFKGAFKPEALRVEAHKRSKMKPFYDRLAEWIYQKARVQEFPLDEALEEENSHVAAV